jgi:hypothetical protein
MAREFLLELAMAGIALLVVAKGDKQLVHILEGKLFKEDKDISIAREIFATHKRLSSVLMFVAAFSSIGATVIFLTHGNPLMPIAGSASIIFLTLGIIGRLKAFRAADRDVRAAARD